MKPSVDVAVLLTCHNRAEKTLRALRHLFDQEEHPARMTVYLVDDGSTDGTGERVRAEFSSIRVIRGSGDLYWCGGMALAFGTALRERHDFYLWINDDAFLFPDAIAKLFETYDSLRVARGDCIVVGATREPATNRPTSSGLKPRKLRQLRFDRMLPGDVPQKCTTFQGNCVLIPASVAEDVGNVDNTFRHYIGDIDYGLRAGRRGHESWLAPGFLGVCQSDPKPPIAGRGAKAFAMAMKQIRGPKGASLPGGTVYSFGEWARFCRRHGGAFWILYFVLPYRRLLRCLVP